jgi:hypothetical protein
MFLRTTAKLQAGYMGRNAKDTIQVAPKKEGNRTSPPPYPGIGRHRFWWKPFIGRGRETKPSVAVTRRVFRRAVGTSTRGMCKCAQPQETSIEIRNNQVDVAFIPRKVRLEWQVHGYIRSNRTGGWEGGRLDARFGVGISDGLMSELALKLSPCIVKDRPQSHS